MRPTTWTNGRHIKLIREQLSWTQEDLAAEARLSVRVIAKAEAGKSLAEETIYTLVRTFCAAGQAVQVPDLTTDPEKLARQIIQSYVVYQAEWVQHCRDIISPNLVAYMDGDPATNPIAGTYRGIDEFDALWRKFFAIFVRDGGSLGDNPQTRCDGNEVLVWGHEYIHTPGVPAKRPGFVMLRLLFERGQLVRFEDYYEANGMMFALNQVARQFPNEGWVKLLRHKATESLGGGSLDDVR